MEAKFADIQEFADLLRELPEQLESVTAIVRNIDKKVDDAETSTSKGISLLEIKYQLMLSYLINLTYLLLWKSQGEHIQGDAAIERLVEIRTVLEKIRPIDQKLKYQIDKLVKTATTGQINENDPLRFKPNPDNLISKLDESESESEGEEEKEMKAVKEKKYVPPKLAPMHYAEDITVKDKTERLLEKAKKRALSSSIMQELKKQYYDGPEEIHEYSHSKIREEKEKLHKERYEEEYLTRLPVTKKEKQATRRNVNLMSNLGQITEFGDLRPLTGGIDEELLRVTKKRKTPRKGPKSKKKHRKFH